MRPLALLAASVVLAAPLAAQTVLSDDMRARLKRQRELAAAPDPGTPASPQGLAASAATPEQQLQDWSRGCPAIARLMSTGSNRSKKGIGTAHDSLKAAEGPGLVGASWYYTWGAKPIDGASGAFVPMIYGTGGPVRAPHRKGEACARDDHRCQAEENADSVADLRPVPPAVLAYNEPDLPKQYLNPLDESWEKDFAPRLPRGVPVVAPAASTPGKWLEDYFPRHAAAYGPLAIHLYEDVQTPDFRVEDAVANFKARFESLRRYGRPIWVTEFGLATWRAADDRAVKFTAEQDACFMAQVLPYLDEHAERYAWYWPGADPHGQVKWPTVRGALYDAQGKLTPLGLLYSR